jgi:hypothetical protein
MKLPCFLKSTAEAQRHRENVFAIIISLRLCVSAVCSFYAFFQQTALEERGSPAENSQPNRQHVV